MTKPKCDTGTACGNACINCKLHCSSSVQSDVATALLGAVRPDYSTWTPLAKGNYGTVSMSPDKTRVVKTALPGKEDFAFGKHEVQLLTSMGKLGYSPKIYSSSANHIEMDVAVGKPLWQGYMPAEGEQSMNKAQATQLAAGLTALHSMGFAHGDAHSQQFIVQGDELKMLDFGLAKPVDEAPRALIQDFNKTARLANWDNPELDGDVNVQRIRKYRDLYKAALGSGAKKQLAEANVAKQYYQELTNAN